VRHWISFHPPLERGVTKFQARVRGFLLRRRLRLAGQGVLTRRVCHNDSEVVTMETAREVHPFDYFSIEEEGRIWWFDQRSMIEWARRNLEIRNPFTRRLFSQEDARRLRELTLIRTRYGLPLLHTENPPSLSLAEVRDLRWMRVVQILHECGFTDVIHHEHFIAMTWDSLQIFMRSLVEDTRWWMYEKCGDKDPVTLQAKRAKYHTWLRSLWHMLPSYQSLPHASRDVAGLLLSCANDISDPTEFMFFILTAYTRSSAAAL